MQRCIVVHVNDHLAVQVDATPVRASHAYRRDRTICASSKARRCRGLARRDARRALRSVDDTRVPVVLCRFCVRLLAGGRVPRAMVTVACSCAIFATRGYSAHANTPYKDASRPKYHHKLTYDEQKKEVVQSVSYEIVHRLFCVHRKSLKQTVAVCQI